MPSVQFYFLILVQPFRTLQEPKGEIKKALSTFQLYYNFVLVIFTQKFNHLNSYIYIYIYIINNLHNAQKC